jgi:NAD(P)-dependent dehydrogenase (short-subunit alcohol dehydrogenase family)
MESAPAVDLAVARSSRFHGLPAGSDPARRATLWKGTDVTLDGKNVIIYGAGDSLGGAVARALAQAGARVFVTHRRHEAAAQVARQIMAAGGRAEADQVDALDQQAVCAHADRVVEQAGSVDVSFNLIGMADTQDIALVDMAAEDFLRPVQTAMRTQFYTATAAGRIMARQGRGVILTLTATPGGIGYPMVGGFGPACCAIESFSRNLASEIGPRGVRVVNLRSAGSPDSRPFRMALAQGGPEVDGFLAKLKDDTMLKALPAMQDIADAAVFIASDHARSITGTTLDITAGTTAALNYKTPTIAFVTPGQGKPA